MTVLSYQLQSDEKLTRFCQKKINKSIDMLRFDFNNTKKVESLDWQSLTKNKAEVLHHLKKHQRLLRICSDVEIEKELVNEGFESAHDIAALSEQEFLNQCKTIEAQIAKKIYLQAKDIKERTTLLTNNLKDVVTSPHYRGSRFCNLKPDLISLANENTNLELLTSDNNLNENQKLQSIFSPYKYLVDLRKLIDDKITKPGDDDLKLHLRRPDLFDDERIFDPHYAENQIPYLQLVNEVLQGRLESLYNLECNEEIKKPEKRSELKIQKLKYQIKDKSIWTLHNSKNSETFELIADGDHEVGSTIFNFLTTNITCNLKDGIALNIIHHFANSASHPLNLPYHSPLSQIRSYLQHFKLDLPDIFELFKIDNKHISRERLNISIEEKSIISTPSIDQNLLKEYYGTANDLGKLRSVDVILTQTGLSRIALEELFYQNLSIGEKNHEKSNQLHRQFYVHRNADHNNYLKIEGNPPNERIINFEHLKSYDRLHRFIRLAKKLKWSFTDLDWILNTIGGTERELDHIVFEKLAHVKTLLKRFDLSLGELSTLWFDLKTYGREDDDRPEDYFDKIFNHPIYFDNTFAKPYRPKYEGNPTFEDEVLLWDSTHLVGKDAQYRQRLIAALNINDNELTLLASFLNNHKIPTNKLDVPTLSMLYRYAKLARTLAIPMESFLELLNIIKTPKITGIDEVVQITRWADWLKESGLTIYQLKYLISTDVNQYVDPGFTLQDANQMLNKLPTANYKTISAENFQTDNIDRPTANTIFSKLKEGQFIDDNGIIIRPLDEINYNSVSKVLGSDLPKIEIPILNFPEEIGSGIYVDCGDHESYNLTEAITYEAWIYAHGQSNGMIFHKGGYWEGQPGYSLYWVKNGDRIQLSFRHKGTESPRGYIEIDADKLKNKWIHIAFTWNLENEKLTLYLNGEEVRSSVFKHEIGISPQPLTFGTFETHFKGHISDVRLWSKSKTKDEIQQDMNRRLNGDEIGLVGYWPINEGTGTTIENKVKGHDNATIKSINGANLPEQQWAETSDLALDQRIVFIVDVLHEAVRIHMSAEDHILILLTELFSEEEELVWATIRLTNKILGIGDYVKLLLNSKNGSQAGLIRRWLYRFAHNLYLAIKLNLDAQDVNGLMDYHKSFGIAEPIEKGFEFDLELIDILIQYKKLDTEFTKANHGLLGVFAIADNEAKRAKLEKVSGWKLTEIERSIEFIPSIGKLHVKDISALKRMFCISQSIGSGITLVHQISQLHQSSQSKNAWRAYNSGAAALLEAINSKYEKEEFEKIITPINNRLQEERRDVMTAYTGHRIDKKERLSDLSDYLLIDLEMSGCAKISRLKSALNSLQMYVYQCRAGLETGIKNNITESEWNEMGQYRIWEAHRKVETFPENYLDPGLRKLKTPLYEEVQQEILQGELTDEAAEKAYRNYFEKFAQQANLKPIDAYFTHVKNPHTNEEEKTIFIIGRARVKPHTYYVRKAIVGIENETKKILITRWTPWESLIMSGSISAETVTPVYAFEKLFLFWVELQPKTQTKTLKDNESIAVTATYAHIQYMYQDNTGHWSSPQTLLDNILIKIKRHNDDNPGNEQIAEWFEEYKISEQLYHEWMLKTDLSKIYWQKVSALFLPKDDQYRNRILVTFGIHKKENRDIKYDGKNHPNNPNNTLGILPIILNEDLTVERQAIKMAHISVNNSHKQVATLFDDSQDNQLLDTKSIKLFKVELTNTLLGNYHHEEIQERAKPIFAKHVHKNAEGIPVKNILGWTMFHNEDEAFLVFPETNEQDTGSKNKSSSQLPEISSRVKISMINGVLNLECKSIEDTPNKSFVRLTTHIVHPLSQRLAAGGLPYLLHLDSQMLEELPFDRFIGEDDDEGFVKPKNDLMDFSGPYGAYYWEIFFHIPFLLAKTLHAKQRFEESKKWFNYIFDPYHPDDTDEIGLKYFWSFEGSAFERINQGTSGITNVNYPSVPDFWPYGPRQVIRFSNKTIAPLGRLFYAFINKVTIDFWLKIDDELKNPVVLFGQSTAKGMSIKWEPLTNKLIFDIDKVLVSTQANLTSNTWHHCAFTYNSNPKTIEIFINGKIQKTEQSISESLGISREHGVILWNQNEVGPGAGMVADLAVWDRVLSNSEVRNRSIIPWRMWRFLPLTNSNTAALIDNLNNATYLSEFARHPLDAESTCRLKVGSFQKAIVMRYVDNLLEWGDSLFTKDSWETNILAALVYIQGKDILGPRPRYYIPADSKSNAAGFRPSQSTPDNSKTQVLELEQMVLPVADTCMLTSGFSSSLDDRFYTPENEELIAYWDLVDDRLFKLRHCMNIEGVIRMLAEYQAPIDPRQIVARLAGNESHGGISGSPSNSRIRFPHYIERAMRASQHVIHLGQSLLTALENMDNAELNSLAAKHELELARMTSNIKEEEIKEQKEVIASLEFGKKRAEAELAYHSTMVIDPIGAPIDVARLTISGAKLLLHTATFVSHSAGIASSMIPTVFGVANGGFNPPAMTESAAGATTAMGDFLGTMDAILANTADWIRQKGAHIANTTYSTCDVARINRDIAAAQIRLSITEKERDIQDRAEGQYTDKKIMASSQFTGPDLYRWMIQRLSAQYMKAFKIAYDLGLSAQKAYHFERSTNRVFLESTHWDSVKKGLLAAEGLLVDLERLDKAYLDSDTQENEIFKEISLKQLNINAFLDLQRSGSCIFDLSQNLFDHDFPGQYCRKIKTISLSIEGNFGKSYSIQATLKQLNNCILLEPDLNTTKFLLQEEDAIGDEFEHLIIDNLVNQQIAVSTREKNAGLFDLKFDSKRYLPFEGTGAISKWELRMPKAANRLKFKDIKDVKIHLKYTSENGSKAYTEQLIQTKALKMHYAHKSVSLRHDFPMAWQQFLVRDHVGNFNMNIELTESLFNVNLRPNTLKIGTEQHGESQVILMPIFSDEASQIKKGEFNLKLNDSKWDTKNGTVAAPTKEEKEWEDQWLVEISLSGLSENFLVKDITSSKTYLDDQHLQDIIMILPYEGELDWSGLLD